MLGKSDKPYLIAMVVLIVMLIIEKSDNFSTAIAVIISLAIAVGVPIIALRKLMKVLRKKCEEQLAIRAEQKRLQRLFRLHNVDSLSGVDFESFIKDIMESWGFQVTATKASGDQGVDLIAELNERRIAIQCKRYTKPVSRHAISDAVAGMAYYGCFETMVVTNNFFTSGAIELAKVNNCTLIDRTQLASWIDQFSSTLTTKSEDKDTPITSRQSQAP